MITQLPIFTKLTGGQVWWETLTNLFVDVDMEASITESKHVQHLEDLEVIQLEVRLWHPVLHKENEMGDPQGVVKIALVIEHHDPLVGGQFAHGSIDVR